MARTWSELLHSVGESLIAVVDAEASMLKEDLRRSGRRLSFAVVLAAVAGFLLFWAIGAAALTLFQVLALWIPAWGAALAVLGLFLLLAAVFGLVARSRFRALEYPAATVRRRLDEHVEWWSQEVLHEGERGDADRLEPGDGVDHG